MLLFACGCMGTEYYDVTSSEVKPPEGIDNVIPQVGASLEVELDYEFDFYTRFQPGQRYKQYRYRVLLNDWEYCYGVVSYEYEKVVIPIMENDSYSPASVVVEGAKALEYKDNPESWDSWHELYRGTQECLPGSSGPKYTDLADKRVIVRIEGKDYPFVLEDTGAGQVLKRLLAGRRVTLPISMENNYIYPLDYDNSFVKELRSSAPPWYGTANARQKAGKMYIGPDGLLHICLNDHTIIGYDSEIGHCVDDYLKDLKKLYPGWHSYKQAEMTIFLEDR